MDSEATTMVRSEDADQPIDLSSRKEAPKSNCVKKRWLAQASAPKFIPLQHIRNAVKRRAHEIDSFTTTTTTTSSTTEDSTSGGQWDASARLDRANSVPYLTALPPLQRHKSLSESRIAPKAAGLPPAPPLTSTDAKTVRWLIDHQQELQRQRIQQMDMLEPAEININYYTKMVQFMHQAGVPTVDEDQVTYDDDDECPELAEIDYSSSPSQVNLPIIINKWSIYTRDILENFHFELLETKLK